MREETRKKREAAKRAIIEEQKAKFTRTQIQKYKEMAATRRDRMKYKQEYLATLFEKANEYVNEQAEKKRPLTIAGFQIALGIPKPTWYDLRKGVWDHALYEYLADVGLPSDYADDVEGKLLHEGVPLITYSEFIDGLYLKQQEMLEEACINKQNPVGAIFLMKALHGHSDNSGVTIQNNTLNVNTEKLGTLDEIENARRLLG